MMARGLDLARHRITCNGRRLSLQQTGRRDESVGGVRFRAWNFNQSDRDARSEMAGRVRSAQERCPWARINALQAAYHDREWGVPVHDDRRLFEFLVLEGAQAGLR